MNAKHLVDQRSALQVIRSRVLYVSETSVQEEWRVQPIHRYSEWRCGVVFSHEQNPNVPEGSVAAERKAATVYLLASPSL